MKRKTWSINVYMERAGKRNIAWGEDKLLVTAVSYDYRA